MRNSPKEQNHLNEDIEALVALGLTTSQARVYLAIDKFREANMSTISREIQVARQDIYRVTSELYKLGLIEKVISSPIRYRALPLKQAVSILLERIHKERIEAQRKAMKLLEKQRKTIAAPQLPILEQQFVLVPKKEALLRKVTHSIENAQIRIDAVCSWKISEKAFFELSESFQKTLERGVSAYWISDKPSNPRMVHKDIVDVSKSSLFWHGVVPWVPKQAIAIFDNAEVYIASNPETGFLESDALWSNCPTLIRLAKNWFDYFWSSSEPQSKL